MWVKPIQYPHCVHYACYLLRFLSFHQRIFRWKELVRRLVTIPLHARGSSSYISSQWHNTLTGNSFSRSSFMAPMQNQRRFLTDSCILTHSRQQTVLWRVNHFRAYVTLDLLSDYQSAKLKPPTFLLHPIYSLCQREKMHLITLSQLHQISKGQRKRLMILGVI